MIDIEMTNSSCGAGLKDYVQVIFSKLHLVDLAGSERVKKCLGLEFLGIECASMILQRVSTT